MPFLVSSIGSPFSKAPARLWPFARAKVRDLLSLARVTGNCRQTGKTPRSPNLRRGIPLVKKTVALLVAAAGSLALLATFAYAGPTSTSAKAGPAGSSAKMTICHRTKSTSHPYRKITVAGTALAAHQRHGADIVPAPPAGCPTSVMTPTRGGRPLSATMTGAAERPGPGDVDGTGTATIRVTPGLGRVCFVLNVANITLPSAAAHIHLAPPTDPGPGVLPLTAPDPSAATQSG